MSWLLCCLRPAAPVELCATVEKPDSTRAGKPASPSKATTSKSLAGRISTSLDHGDDISAQRPLAHAAFLRMPKGSQQGLSEDTVASALSTTPTSLNPFAYFFPFVSDERDECSAVHAREDVDALGSNAPPQQPRSKVDFADLCGSLEDLIYLGEGSNGVVYSASWHGARVAVKFLLGNNDDGTHLQRCFTEAVLSRVLSHPCVVQCFATAISQLTPEIWEGIRTRCRRNQSILQSTSLGRCVAAAVLQQQQQEQERLSDHWDQPSNSQQQLSSMRRGLHSGPPPASLQLPPQSQASSQRAQSPPQMQLAAQRLLSEPCDDDQAILDMRKVETFFADEVNGSGELSGDGPGACEGISLMQALLDLKAEAGRHCTVVVMEYMDAGTLHHAIVRGEFSARRSLEHRTKLLALLLTAQELAQGMAHLHGLDILHGDLKPTNVLLKGTPCQYAGAPGVNGVTCTDPRGYTTKIADLGLARSCPGETAQLSSDQWGALAYLAPEAAKGSCCKASDVYSFGVMLWEMSAGVRPYLGLTTPQVLMGLVTGTLQLTWPADGSLYSPLRSLAVACTDFNPAERPSFEVAARILGRMVRHIRAASESLRQRHSSALSMEVSGQCTNCNSPGGNNYTGRSMPIYVPSHSTLGSVPTTPSSAVPRAPVTPIAAAALAASQSCAGGRVAAGGVAVGRASQPIRMACGSSGCGSGTSGNAGGSIVTGSSGTCGAGRGGSGAGGGGGGGGSSPCTGDACIGGGSFWNAGGGPAPQLPYPRTRRGGGGGLCGGAVRSPLGASSSLRMLPSEPLGDGPMAWKSAPGTLRPGSSPAHAHVS